MYVGFTSEIEMYDLSGKKIKKSVDHSIIAGRNVIEFDVSSLSNGTYFIQTRFDGAVKVNKAVVLN